MVGLGVGVAVALGELVGELIGELLGFGAATTTPLSHTNFLPLLIQVYFFPETVDVEPIFEHADPALTAAWALDAHNASDRTKIIAGIGFLMKFSRP
jgi:hypothetical protein